MDWKGREQSQNVEDRRGSSGGGGGKTPGILGIIVVLVGAYYGVDLSGLVGGSSSMGIPTQQAFPTRQPTRSRVERTVPRRPCRYGKSMEQIFPTTRPTLHTDNHGVV